MDDLFEDVRAAIRRSHLSVDQIAFRAGLSRNTVRSWMKGPTKQPYSSSLMKVAGVLSLTVTIAPEGLRARSAPVLPLPPAKSRTALWRLRP